MKMLAKKMLSGHILLSMITLFFFSFLLGNVESRAALDTEAANPAQSASTTPESDPSSANTAATKGTEKKPVDSAERSQEDADEITPEQLDLNGQISEKLTEDRKLCVKLGKKPEGITFRMEGPASRSIPPFEPTPLTYCINLVLNDYTDGAYKLTVEAQTDGQTVSSTRSVEVSRSDSRDAQAAQAAALENKCSQDGADSSEECRAYYLEKYKAKIRCQDMESAECYAAARDTHIQQIVGAEKTYERINSQAEKILGKCMTAGKLENLVNQNDKIGFSIPLKAKETAIKVISSYENVTVGKYKGLILSTPIVVLFDSDGDGVSDDIEVRIGTKKDKKDTDEDGYTDGEELLHGYDPLGEGKRDLNLSAVEKALVENKTIGQPTDSGEEIADFKAEEVEIIYGQKGEEDSYVITGKAQPDILLALYVYSDVPIVATVKTDAEGNWEYHFAKTLENGKHEVYVATHDDAGRVVKKSAPLAFVIEEAPAADEAPAAALAADTDTKPASGLQMGNYNLYIAGALIILGLVIFLLVLARSRKNKPQQPQQ